MGTTFAQCYFWLFIVHCCIITLEFVLIQYFREDVWRFLFETNRTKTGALNPLTPNDYYTGRTSTITSKRCILYIYSTNTVTGCFKHGICSSFFSLQNAICFVILTYLVPVLFTFYLQGVLKLKK